MASGSQRTSRGELAKYEIIGDLATGGMAELFLARSTGIEGFEKVVALKRILPQLASNAEFVSMFLDEARIAACLAHPNIAQVYDIGRDQGSYFFTMEYVQGKDLRHVMRAADGSGGLPIEHALHIIHGVAAGLHYAHEKVDGEGHALEIVHRDVSPANVIVTFDGGVKLVDFGVAKARSRSTETEAGTLKGKIAYMSPEQCRGEPVDRRSDVFSLGILLYELTTGTRLFTGDTDFALITKVANNVVPPPSRRKPTFPRELEYIIMKALARSPEQRYQTAEAVLEDLEGFAHAERLALSAVTLRKYMRLLFREDAELAEGPTSGFATGSGQTPAVARAPIIMLEAELPSRVLALPLPAPPTESRVVARVDHVTSVERMEIDVDVDLDVVPPAATLNEMCADPISLVVRKPEPAPDLLQLMAATAFADAEPTPSPLAPHPSDRPRRRTGRALLVVLLTALVLAIALVLLRPA